tara:strand:- start:33 stop:392 length:360 start_codon:yes stop_codon:yes gene_type:complete
MTDLRPKTIFCDIDGTLIKHNPPGNLHVSKTEVLEGTIEKLHEWDKKGYNIILTTGRKESLRKYTEEQLRSCGIFYDKLIMGIGGGTRVLINDLKSDSNNPTAYSFCIERNKGIGGLDV